MPAPAVLAASCSCPLTVRPALPTSFVEKMKVKELRPPESAALKAAQAPHHSASVTETLVSPACLTASEILSASCLSLKGPTL